MNKEIHTGTDWNNDFEKALAIKLINEGLKKTAIAYQVANAIDEDLFNIPDERTFKIVEDDPNDSIHYIVKAIKYATGN